MNDITRIKLIRKMSRRPACSGFIVLATIVTAFSCLSGFTQVRTDVPYVQYAEQTELNRPTSSNTNMLTDKNHNCANDVDMPNDVVDIDNANKKHDDENNIQQSVAETDGLIVETENATSDVTHSRYKKENLDYRALKASYNLLAATAQLEMGNTVEEVLMNSGDAFEFSSIGFVSWCSSQIGYENIVPIVDSVQELQKFYQDNGLYYRTGCCYPRVGDLVLFDLDGDSIPDHVEIITIRTDSYFLTIGALPQSNNSSLVVDESEYTTHTNEVFGFCRPNYPMTQLQKFNDSTFKFNAVDTIVAATNQYHADVLANNGIEVIARYINPESRVPLSVEEAQLYFNANVRVMMIYEVNADDPYKGYDKGVEIGRKALEYARNLGAPQGTPIFYCCDCVSDFENVDQVSAFLCGIEDVMQGEYGIGLYGGFHIVEAMHNVGLIDAYWQCWGFSAHYLSDNFDMIQYSNSYRHFKEIPYVFDANYVKNPEKVSYILPSNR